MGASGNLQRESKASWPRLFIGLLLATIFEGEVVRVRSQINQTPTQLEKNREKAYLKMQFTRHFRLIQVVSQGLVEKVEDGSLTSSLLTADSRKINKSARSLRTLIALGDLAQEVELKTSFSTTSEFEDAVRQLGELVRQFARNPSHQNSRILNTDQASSAQTDLLSIIRLSKALSEQGRRYTRQR
ncbi:MAG: hypothetical protein EBU88_11155 [Acidobacteria bacterium]|nr:hypothetical protein [Acidobacteriota bacterium]